MPIEQVIALVARDERELATLQSMKIDSPTSLSLDLSSSTSVKCPYNFTKSLSLPDRNFHKATPFYEMYGIDKGLRATPPLSADLTTVTSNVDEVRKFSLSPRLTREPDCFSPR